MRRVRYGDEMYSKCETKERWVRLVRLARGGCRETSVGEMDARGDIKGVDIDGGVTAKVSFCSRGANGDVPVERECETPFSKQMRKKKKKK